MLQLPVPALEDFVRERTAHYDAGFLGRSQLPGQDFVHAHVTLLGPFDALPDPARVAAALAGLGPTRFWLRRVDVFGNGIIHAVPEPERQLRRLTGTLRRAFPQVVPYRGEFPVRHHLTLDAVGPGVDRDWVAERTSRVLPVLVEAGHVDLVWYESGSTRLVERFALRAAGA